MGPPKDLRTVGLARPSQNHGHGSTRWHAKPHLAALADFNVAVAFLKATGCPNLIAERKFLTEQTIRDSELKWSQRNWHFAEYGIAARNTHAVAQVMPDVRLTEFLKIRICKSCQDLISSPACR